MNEHVIERPGGGERLTAGPTATVVKVPGAATDGRLSAVEMHLGGGWDGPPPHVHGSVDHLWWVLDGRVRLRVGDEVHDLGAGACAFVPAGVPHGFSTVGSDGAVVLQVDTPRALDGYFRELAAVFPDAAPPDPAAVGAVMGRHDTHPLPAPGTAS